MAKTCTRLEKFLIFLVVLVLLAATVLALILGLMTRNEKREVERKILPVTCTPTFQGDEEEKIEPKTEKEKPVIAQESANADKPECPSTCKPTYPENCTLPQASQSKFSTIIHDATTSLIAHYKYLVSLSEPLYINETTTYKFICSGVAIEKNKILTGKCVDEFNYRHIVVRSESDQWSHGGKTHKITKFHTFVKDGVTVCIIDSMIQTPISLNYDDWDFATLAGWEKNPLLPMKENTPYTHFIYKSSLEFLPSKNIYVSKTTRPCDDKLIGQPLLIGIKKTPKLLGIVTGEGCDSNTNYGSKDTYYGFVELKDYSPAMFNIK